MRSEASAPNSSSASPATASVPPICLVHMMRPRSASTQPTAAWNERAQSMSPVRSGRTDQVGEPLDLVGAARRADRHLPADGRGVRVDARHPRPLADDQRVLERARSRPPAPASADRRGAAPARAWRRRQHRRPAPPGRRRGRRPARRRPAARSRPATPSAFFHLTWPASSAIRSPPRVTTAATLPSLPTPAESLAPTLARQIERPLAASRATTLPSLEARVTTPPLTAGPAETRRCRCSPSRPGRR